MYSYSIGVVRSALPDRTPTTLTHTRTTLTRTPTTFTPTPTTLTRTPTLDETDVSATSFILFLNHTWHRNWCQAADAQELITPTLHAILHLFNLNSYN